MEDGTLLLLLLLLLFHIQSGDNDAFDDLIYCEQSYFKILKDLKYNDRFNCHVDPDFSFERRKNTIDGVRFLDRLIHQRFTL